jgi:hypothetical protein
MFLQSAHCNFMYDFLFPAILFNYITLEPEERIELSFEPYHGSVLPLNYSGNLCGPGGIRTPEGRSHDVYSVTPLAAWVPTHLLTYCSVKS